MDWLQARQHDAFPDQLLLLATGHRVRLQPIPRRMDVQMREPCCLRQVRKAVEAPQPQAQVLQPGQVLREEVELWGPSVPPHQLQPTEARETLAPLVSSVHQPRLITGAFLPFMRDCQARQPRHRGETAQLNGLRMVIKAPQAKPLGPPRGLLRRGGSRQLTKKRKRIFSAVVCIVRQFRSETLQASEGLQADHKV